jgi:hypothetical protein
MEICWRTPDELIKVGFDRSHVVMINEAHHGLLRCTRTREVGRQILPTAHQLGVRHLAMEALYKPEIAQIANRTRQASQIQGSYLGQPEMQNFIQAALDLGWTLLSYEADSKIFLSQKLGEDFDDEKIKTRLSEIQPILLSMESTNWREEQQARNLIQILTTIGSEKLLVWCGNGHLSKLSGHEWLPMGYQFKRLSGIDAFAIDQIRTVDFPNPDETFVKQLQQQYRADLEAHGGTAGFLIGEAPDSLKYLGTDDAYIFSIYNRME